MTGLRLACSVLIASGCSMGVVPVAPDWKPQTKPKCTSGSGLPVADLVGTAGLAVLGLVLISADDRFQDHSQDGSGDHIELDTLPFGLLALGAAVLTGLSARSGFQSTSTCRAAHGLHVKTVTAP